MNESCGSHRAVKHFLTWKKSKWVNEVASFCLNLLSYSKIALKMES